MTASTPAGSGPPGKPNCVAAPAGDAASARPSIAARSAPRPRTSLHQRDLRADVVVAQRADLVLDLQVADGLARGQDRVELLQLPLAQPLLLGVGIEELARDALGVRVGHMQIG